MYQYSINSETKKHVARLEELRSQFAHRGVLPRRWVGRLRRELEAEAVAASTSMEGVAVTAEEVRRVLAGDAPPGVTPVDVALVEGYRDAMSFVLRRADDPDFVWQRELILAIHDRVMRASFAARAGRLREGPVLVVDGGSGEVRYEPPAAEAVPQLVDELAGWAQSSPEPTPIVAALVHARFAGVHPFKDGNGRVGRILASLAMYRGGYVLPEFTSLEEWWGSHRSDYYEAFRCLGRQWDADADATPFLEAHVRAQRLQAEALDVRQRVERQIWTALEDIVTEDLHGQPRLAEALFDAFFGRTVTNRYYRGLADVSIATAVNDLARLGAAGLLVASGAGRSRSYTGTFRLLALVASAASVEVLAGEAPLEAQRAQVVAGIAEHVSDGRCAG
jgi:Fic family protein